MRTLVTLNCWFFVIFLWTEKNYIKIFFWKTNSIFVFMERWISYFIFHSFERSKLYFNHKIITRSIQFYVWIEKRSINNGLIEMSVIVFQIKKENISPIFKHNSLMLYLFTSCLITGDNFQLIRPAKLFIICYS